MWFRILLFVAVVSCNADEEYDFLQGEPTTIEKYPFAVQILNYQFGGRYVFRCAGTLVTKRYVLSAARCFVSSSDCAFTTTTPTTTTTTPTTTTKPTTTTTTTNPTTTKKTNPTTTKKTNPTTTKKTNPTTTKKTNITTTVPPKKPLRKRSGLYIDPAEYRVRVGSTRIKDSGGIRQEVSAIIVHENYSRYDNDIALVRTRNPIRLGLTIAIINIPQQEVMMPDNATVTVIGWGSMGKKYKQGELHKVSIKKINWQRCKNIYSKNSTNITITDNMICCDGDIGHSMEPAYCTPGVGSPLLYGDNLVGLAIWFGSCGNNDTPYVFTRISKYTSWIDNVIKQSTYRADPHPGASSMNKIEVTLLIPILYSVLSA